MIQASCYSLGAHIPEVRIMSLCSKGGRFPFEPELKVVKVPSLIAGDFVVKTGNPTYVGKVSKTRLRFSTKKWQILVRPIHESVGRSKKKSHWCSMDAWRKVSPLEMLSVQGESE